jgi:myo-inositol-1-phosphate synthase
MDSKAADGPRRLGVWFVGVKGAVATTAIAGARLIARGLAASTGLVTESAPLEGLDLCALESMHFGGHDIRGISMVDAALEVARENGSIGKDSILSIAGDLREIDQNVRRGTSINCGESICGISDDERGRNEPRTLPDIARAIREDIEGFRTRLGLDGVVVVNLASTEPALLRHPSHASAAGLEDLIAKDQRSAVRASTLYAQVALDLGCPWINFTPSNAGLLPGHVELAKSRGVPLAGNDGKTGETLVKSALAPMFAYRALKVLTWHGYNILGDRDGQVLAHKDNKAAKVATKDGVLEQILGYQPQTHVAIEYARSLADLKTAWDFIHFEGFLGYRMSLQFTWQGCDSILAAPLVIDLVRLAELAKRRGESGLLEHLACFFKQPAAGDSHNLHEQFQALVRYAERLRGGRAAPEI